MLPIRPQPARNWGRLLRRLGVAAALGVPLVGLGAVGLDRWGRDFYATGRQVVDTLEVMARAVEARDITTFGAMLSPRYRGEPLGLTDLVPLSERDGVRVLGFAPGGAARDRAAALGEWESYLGGFASIDEVGLHLHRLVDWSRGGEVDAAVRFELIGTPAGAPRSVIDRAWFRMRFVPGPAGLALAGAALIADDPTLPAERVASDAPQFVDVAPAAGVAFENRTYPPFLTLPLRFGMIRFGPGGITAADVDGDGWADLFIPDGVAARLFRNRRDGTFEDVTERAGLGGLSGVSVGLFADVDDDGDEDLFVSRTFEPNQLFLNRGDGTFEDATARSGLDADCCTTVAAMADVDNDGDLDLYVGRYLDPRREIPTTFYARNGEPNQLYRNDGGGTFTNVTAAAGVGDTGLCLGAVFGDYDDDGDPDLFVANDFGRKTLYRNEGDGTFSDVTVAAGTLAYGAGMSASFADVDNDGRFDLYVAHIRSEDGWFAAAPTVARYMVNSFRQGVWRSDMPLYAEIFRQSGFGFVGVFQQMASGNTLLRNRGDGTFEDVSWQARANPPGWFWGSVVADLDNDGWQDVYSANGWVYGRPGTEIELDFLNNVVSKQDVYKTGAFFNPDTFGGLSWHGYERNRHLRNDGDGTFTEIGHAAGTDLVRNSRGVAVADFWNRGALDLAVAASGDRHALLRNEVGPRHHWLEVDLAGGAGRLANGSNRNAVGARVEVEAGGLRQVREVVLGDSYGSESSLRLHFGLGDETAVERLTVRWPRSGIVQTFGPLGADRIVAVAEGVDELVVEDFRPPPPAGPSAAARR
jgi:ASPIC and UnbV/FG-GAP-like repeat